MTVTVCIDEKEVPEDFGHKINNLRVVYGDRITATRGYPIIVTVLDTNSEEIKHFAEYLYKIDKGLELYNEPL